MRPKGCTHHVVVRLRPSKNLIALVLASRYTPSLYMYVFICLEELLKQLYHLSKSAQDAGEEREMGTGMLGFISVTPPCSSDTFKPAHLSLPSEICFYNFAKTFIYGSGQLAAWRAMCQWSWRMLNVWYGSAQTASTWFANIPVLCIYKAASEMRGFWSKVSNMADSLYIKAIPQYTNTLR